MPIGLDSLSTSNKPSGYNTQMKDLRDRLDQMKIQLDELTAIEPFCEYFHH